MDGDLLSDGLPVLVFVTIIIGGSIVLLFYLLRLIKGEQKEVKPVKSKHVLTQHELFLPVKINSRNNQNVFVTDEKIQQFHSRKRDQQRAGQTQKKNVAPRVDTRSTQFTNPWLIGTMKGHTGQVLNMDFSANGKYIASCADGK